MRRSRTISYLLSLQKFGVKLGLQNIRILLEDLEHPERRCPVILVTGTNGKGSVAAMLSASLAAKGLKVGLYTSPHLVRLGERIAVGGKPIRPARLAAHVRTVRTAIDRLRLAGRLAQHPTFFEVVTAAAFLEFARAAVDIAVLEVGLGGRFDATNASEPLVSVLTTVELEHTRYLGDTVEAIAFEKSAIARPRRPLVTGLGPGGALEVVRQHCRAIGAALVLAHRRARARLVAASRRGLRFTVKGYPGLSLPLPGRHQLANAEVAIAALEALPARIRPTPAEVARGLRQTRWPGRIEYRKGHPAILLDGAHNPHAARALALYLDEFERHRTKILVFGCLGDKDVAGVLAPLAPLFDQVVLTPIDNPRALAPRELVSYLPRGVACVSASSSRAALAMARRRAGRNGLIAVTGSLYLVGEVKARLARRPPPDQG